MVASRWKDLVVCGTLDVVRRRICVVGESGLDHVRYYCSSAHDGFPVDPEALVRYRLHKREVFNKIGRDLGVSRWEDWYRVQVKDFQLAGKGRLLYSSRSGSKNSIYETLNKGYLPLHIDLT